MMALRRWTPEELEFLEANHLLMEYADIGKALDRSEAAVRNKCHRLWGDAKSPMWTEDELALLRQHYGSTDIKLDELSAILDKHKTNVSRKAREFGLTSHEHHKLSASGRQRMSAKIKASQRRNGHPKGFKGRKHSKAAKKKISEAVKQMWADPEALVNSEEHRQQRSDNMTQFRKTHKITNPYSRAKRGKRKDLGDQFFRSAWEANYARYLNWLKDIAEIADWEYEPQVFEFSEIKRGTRTYTPDFRIVNLDGTIEWHEVKGWMDAKSKTRIRRFRKYYPDEKLVVIDAECYHAIREQCKAFVPNWE